MGCMQLNAALYPQIRRVNLRHILLGNTDSFALDTCELIGATVDPIRLALLENRVIKCSETLVPYALRALRLVKPCRCIKTKAS